MSSDTFIAGYADLVVEFYFTKYVSKEVCPIDKKWYDKLRGIKYVEEMDLLLKDYFQDPSFEAKRYDSDYNLEKCYLDNEGNEVHSYEFDEENGTIMHRYPSEYNYERDYRVINLFRVCEDFWLNIIKDKGFNYVTKNWLQYGLKYVREDYGCNCLIEVKPYIDSFGAVLRQINSYKRFYNKRTRLGKTGASNYWNTKFCLFTFDKRFDKQFESQGIIVLHPWTSEQEMLEMYGLG